MNDNDDNAPAPYPQTPAVILPAFTPVPRLKDRHNGWKPHVQRAFIEGLAETGSVKAACRRVGGPTTAPISCAARRARRRWTSPRTHRASQSKGQAVECPAS